MKKIFTLIICGIIAFSLLGCSPKNNSDSTKKSEVTNKIVEKDASDKTKYTIKDYYPLNENVKYIYDGEGNEYAPFTTYIDYLTENKLQVRSNNGGTETVSVIQIKDGELTRIFSKGEVYYRENFTTNEGNESEVLLKEPIVKGTEWTLADGRKRSITDLSVDITVPFGNFKCLEITTVDKNNTTKNYYALNIGLVKTVYKSGDFEVSSFLSKIEKDVPYTQKVKFYYPNVIDDKLYVEIRELSFKTNDITKLSFEKYFKEAPNKNIGKLIGPNTKIRSLYLNKDNMVYVDFSSEFTKEMNLGSGPELMTLQCITNTLGDYYGVKKVYITVEGTPYSSGHIIMKKGEPFTVDYKNVQ